MPVYCSVKTVKTSESDTIPYFALCNPDGVPPMSGPDTTCNVQVQSYTDGDIVTRTIYNQSLPVDSVVVADSGYKRLMQLTYIPHADGDDSTDDNNEVEIAVTMKWKAGTIDRSIVVRENMFNWK